MLTVEKQWVNVQQKTFTKWYVFIVTLEQLSWSPSLLPASPPPPWAEMTRKGRNQAHRFTRLNDKLKARLLAIEDLVKDLSDGVSLVPSLVLPMCMMPRGGNRLRSRDGVSRGRTLTDLRNFPLGGF